MVNKAEPPVNETAVDNANQRLDEETGAPNMLLVL